VIRDFLVKYTNEIFSLLLAKGDRIHTTKQVLTAKKQLASGDERM